MHTHSAKQSQCITNGVRDEVINMIMQVEHKISKQKKKSNLLIRFKILYLMGIERFKILSNFVPMAAIQ